MCTKPFGHCPSHRSHLPSTGVLFAPQSLTHVRPSITKDSEVKHQPTQSSDKLNSNTTSTSTTQLAKYASRSYYYYYYAAFNVPCVGHKDDESQAHLTEEQTQTVTSQTFLGVPC